jgi:hypothetical protein
MLFLSSLSMRATKRATTERSAMKTITASILLSVLAAASAPALAQTAAPAGATSEPESLVGHHQPDSVRLSGWFLAPTFGTTSFGNTLAYMPGLRGGIYLNRRLAVGLTLNGLGMQETSFSRHEVRNVGTYGGLLLQYIVHSNNIIHVSAEATVGNGQWCSVINDGNGASDGCQGRRFLAFEPVANIELNVAKHLRVATGVGYRFAAAASGDGPSSREMSGLVARTALVFGSF